MLLRCPCDAEDLKPAEEDCQRHKRGRKGGGMGPEGSSAMPCAVCSGREVCWVLCVPTWDWTGMRSLGPCPAVRAHVPNPCGTDER